MSDSRSTSTRRRALKYAGLTGLSGVAGLTGLSLTSQPAIAVSDPITLPSDLTEGTINVSSYEIQYAELDTASDITVEYILTVDGTLQPESDYTTYQIPITEKTGSVMAEGHTIDVPAGEIGLQIRITHSSVQTETVTASDNATTVTSATELVNDFESQDGVPVNSNWGSEVVVRSAGGGTIDGYDTSSPLEGTTSRLLGGDGGGETHKHVRDTAAQFSSFSGKLQLLQDDGENSDEVRISLRSGSSRVILFEVKCDNRLMVNGVKQGSWSSTPTDPYLFEATNIDWAAETFDWTITNLATSSVVASATGEAFMSTASDADSVFFGGDHGGVSGTVEGKYDSLSVQP